MWLTSTFLDLYLAYLFLNEIDKTETASLILKSCMVEGFIKRIANLNTNILLSEETCLIY